MNSAEDYTNFRHRAMITHAVVEITMSVENLLKFSELSAEAHSKITQILEDAKEYVLSDYSIDRNQEFFDKLEEAIKVMMDTEMYSGAKADKIMADIRAITGHGSSQEGSTIISRNGNTTTITQNSINKDNVIGDIEF